MDHLQSIRLFVKVADLGSFARAADAMDISKAIATRHIADLEGQLGTRLLNRTTRKLSLTEPGEVYLERVRPILQELEDAEQVIMARNHEPVGTLRIAAPVVFGLYNLALALRTYTQRYPKVVPDLTLVDRPVDLVDERFDLAIVITRRMSSTSIVTRRLTTGCMTVCAAPVYIEQYGAPTHPAQLAEHQCLSLPDEYSGTELAFVNAQGTVHVRPSKVIVANNTAILRQFALLGMGVAVLPSYLVDVDIRGGNLVRLMTDHQLPRFEIKVAYPSRRHLSAKVRTFIDHLIAHFADTSNLLPCAGATQNCESTSSRLQAA
ncbi:MAG: LysR family transcriptional regulator [Paraburkholderia sp.]|nr:MAG: LysR family transcriptional regulator [Paraburkholderia sp.]